LGSQSGLSGTIELDGEGSHRATEQPKLAILVLLYDQGRTHLFATTRDRSDPDAISPCGARINADPSGKIADTEIGVRQ
jgi:hypothetical protein